MNEFNEKYPEETLPEEQLTEVEPYKKTADDMVPIIDIEELARQEREKLLKKPIIEA